VTLFRGFSSVPVMDDNVVGFVQEIWVPTVRDVQTNGIVARRRVARIREDTLPLTFEVRGTFIDASGSQKFWRDFKAAMMNQVQQPFDHGDGTEFRAVDCVDVVHTRKGGVFAATNNAEMMLYSAKCLSYEPYARSKGPALSAGTALNNGNGTFTTTVNVSYAGTAPGEPTWQVTLVVPNGITVTQVRIQNTTTGETCTCAGLTITNGTFYLLMDACGGGASNTPNNNGYGLLAIASNGFGATLSGTGDIDFTGNPPTLAVATGVPPVAMLNVAVVSLTANGALTSATLNWLAPSRWYR
jgi:hypothetical protein